jgi:hypothetical protein
MSTCPYCGEPFIGNRGGTGFHVSSLAVVPLLTPVLRWLARVLG